MKALLFTFLLLPSFVFAQLSGKYYASPYFSESLYRLRFGSDSTFQYWDHYSYDDGGCIIISMGNIGQGHYKVVKDTLLLHFEPDTIADFSAMSIDTLPKAAENLCRITFSIKDELKEGLIGAKISTSHYTNDENTIITTDTDGNATIILPRSETQVYIGISYLGYETQRSILCTASHDYSINTNMKVFSGMSSIAVNSEKKYLIKKICHKHLNLQLLTDNHLYRYSLSK